MFLVDDAIYYVVNQRLPDGVKREFCDASGCVELLFAAGLACASGFGCIEQCSGVHKQIESQCAGLGRCVAFSREGGQAWVRIG